jgi:hypothetical protein
LFQGEVKNPPKTADNPFFKSKYTTLDVLIDTAKPLLQKNGLSYLQSCSGDGSNIVVTTLLMHNSGEWIESDPLTLKADKATAQGAGSAITYARRYALAAALGLASDEDDDGNGAEGDKPKKPQNPPQGNKPVGNDNGKPGNEQGSKNDSGKLGKPSKEMLTSLLELSKKKGINLKTFGQDQTKKQSSEEWDILDYSKVLKALEAIK